MSRIAFIGLGNMGAPMAANLLKAGHALRVHDRVAPAMAGAVAAGAEAAGTARDCVAGAEIVLSMLPATGDVESLYLGDDALMPAIEAQALVIDCSTIAPQAARRLAQAAADRGLAMLDAPVSGGTAGAAAGTLTFIVGGEAAALERARPVLSAMGRNIFHAGAHGAGQAAKICNNLMLGIQMAGLAEALALGAVNGLDPRVLSEIMARSSGRNWALEVYNPWPGVMENVPSSRGYTGGFGVDLMLKDLGLAAEAALATRASIPLGELARNLYSLHSAAGAGALDFSSILRLYRREP
jgi:3-hydroxyisobutyrate dehydrogenase